MLLAVLLSTHQSRREILGSRSRFEPSTVAPGQNSGGTPYRQLCPAYPFADFRCFLLVRTGGPRAKGSAGTFQRGSFRTQLQSGNVFQKLNHDFCAVLHRTHGLHQAWIYSRNQTTIATETKHRQPMFLHPTANAEQQIVRARRGLLAESASSLYTTKVFRSYSL
jgi:hypothetical protein